jgi:hypothetical protein
MEATETPQTKKASTIEDMVARYISLRDMKAQAKAAYDAQVGQVEEAMSKIENYLLNKANELGVDSFKTGAGTAYVSTRSSCSVADWDAFKTFAEGQEDPFMFIEKKASKTAVEQYRAIHQDLPPGLNWSEVRVVNFRR